MCDINEGKGAHNVNVLLSFFTFIFAVLLQFADSVKFISGLNNVVFSDCDFP